MDHKQICVDFLEGKCTYELFAEKIKNDDGLVNWIDETAAPFMSSFEIGDDGVMKQKTFSLRFELKKQISVPDSIRYRLNLHGFIEEIIARRFPNDNIVYDRTYEEQFDLYMDSCPDYIDGPEVWKSGIIDKIIDECPEEWSKSKKIKAIKQKIKEEFHIEKSNYPRWIQVPDWPFSNGKPMKYVGKTIVRKGEWIKHHFVDVETGEERVVDDMD